MTRSRVIALGVLVTALLVIVALVANGRPVGGGGGARREPPAAFFDYAWTTVVILMLIVFAAGIVGLWYLREEHGQPRPYWLTIRSLLVYCVFALLFAYLWHHIHYRPHGGSGEPTTPLARNGSHVQSGSSHGTAAQGQNHFQWPELFVVLGLLVAVGVLLFVRQARGVQPVRRDPQQALAIALDESLDDLRADPDLRRAIIAAYARMEAALGVAGIPRRPAEAPLEYLERALLSLDTSAEAVRRLTDLFEWARFSHHDPEPSMRDDAVDALVAVRDELRASELIPA